MNLAKWGPSAAASLALLWSSTALAAMEPRPTASEVLGRKTTTGAAWTPPGTIANDAISKRIYFTPTPAGKVTIFEGGQPKEVSWGALSQDQIRALMDTQDENVIVEQIDDDAGVSVMGSGAKLKRGNYRVTYYYYRFRSALCDPKSLTNGTIAVGSGLVVTAEIRTLKAGVKVAELLPLALEASRDRVRGTMRAQSFGLSSGKSSISPYLATAVGGLTTEGIRKAIESFGVVKAISDTSAISISPSYLFLDAPDPSKCALVG